MNKQYEARRTRLRAHLLLTLKKKETQKIDINRAWTDRTREQTSPVPLAEPNLGRLGFPDRYITT